MKRAALALLIVLSGCGLSPVAPGERTGVAMQARATDPDQQAKVRAIFDAVDTDHDGYVTMAEMLAAPGWKPGQKEQQAAIMMAFCDRDHDGRLSFDEVKNVIKPKQGFGASL